MRRGSSLIAAALFNEERERPTLLRYTEMCMASSPLGLTPSAPFTSSVCHMWHCGRALESGTTTAKRSCAPAADSDLEAVRCSRAKLLIGWTLEDDGVLDAAAEQSRPCHCDRHVADSRLRAH